MKKKKTVTKVLEINIGRIYPLSDYLSMKRIFKGVCHSCKRKDYFIYEICSLVDDNNKKIGVYPICGYCLRTNGYERVLGRGGWIWKKGNRVLSR